MKEIISLDEIKKLELDIMKKIHIYCIENDISYYLCYGTLIGAVRHKGFIPWDDDIDIFMIRKDYDKFLKSFPNEEDKLNLKLVNYKTKPYYGRNLSKVIDTNTVLIEPQYKTDDPIGVFVDIWPLDGLPNNKIHRWFYIKKANLLKKMILASSMKYNSEYTFCKKIGILLGKILNPKKAVIKMDYIARKYNYEDSNYVKCYPAKHVLYDKNDFEGRILMEFEGEQFYGPKNYDSILKAEYGDYMKLPPVEKQMPHHIMNTYYY